ncbi:MAG: flagellar basal body P-ring protein FlgI [Planctomycetes bacterium]|nr:flagellar basal body P-ring protein FlgI [Planctomycetota bacterium]
MRYLAFAAAILVSATPAAAQRRVRDICRVKGQEENTLQGLGLVVGLKGTGDGAALPTSRALANMMRLMGNPIPLSTDGQPLLEELKDSKNVALVMVTATVPAQGGRQGDLLNCQVNALSAKSLDGGYLLTTPLVGPRPGDTRVFALAQGPIHLPDPTRPASAGIHKGCRLEADFRNAFVGEDYITLVLDKEHATWQTAQDVAAAVNNEPDFLEETQSSDEKVAHALDQVNVVVRIPSHYRADAAQFVAAVMDARLATTAAARRVVINERAGTIVFGADVEVGPVAVTHNGLTLQTGEGPVNQFVGVETGATARTRLEGLIQALNAIKAPPKDVIEIIKGLERSGALYGELTIE